MKKIIRKCQNQNIHGKTVTAEIGLQNKTLGSVVKFKVELKTNE